LTPLSILLTLASALIHSSWNFIVKKRNWPVEFYFWVFLVGPLFYLPFFLGFEAFPLFFSHATIKFWLLSIVSGLIQTVYLICLIEGYRVGDLSLVYPISRASPLFTQIWAVLFIGEILSAIGVLGIVLVTAGIFVISSGYFRSGGSVLPYAHSPSLPYLLAFTGAMMGSIYSVIDKVCVEIGHPVFYIWLTDLWMCGALGVYHLIRKRAPLLRAWHEGKRDIPVIAVLQNASYLLVLLALQMSKVSYVVAFRQVAALFGAALGIIFLKEEHGMTRMIGAVILTLGLILVGLAK
jgi:uncharacterized membrane protein